ncbi:MAG TPA: GNAT family N-acetyltransferase [Thermoanaerobaculia bacterium]|jgi:ribosomal protein S18 acetylase RimI-like enzyme
MGADDIRIRAGVPQDLDRLKVIAARLSAFGPPPWRRGEDIVEAEVGTLRRFFAGTSRDSALLVAESREGVALGFVYLETLTDYFTGQKHGHIGILAVGNEAEGKGVGGRLLDASEGWARSQGYRLLTLNVFDGNRRARAVYEHLGYMPETLRYVKTLR